MKYESMAAIKRANKRAGRFWFSKDTMRFFSTRIHTRTPIGGCYFVTSERMDYSYPWKYSVRKADDKGSIETIGDVGQLSTRAAAIAHAKKHSKKDA